MQNSKTVAETLLGETAHFDFCPPKLGFFGGGWGGPRIFFSHWNPNIFIIEESMQKIRSLRKPLMGILPLVRPKSPWHANGLCMPFFSGQHIDMISVHVPPFHSRYCILATMNALHLSFFCCLPTMDCPMTQKLCMQPCGLSVS